MYWDRLTTKQFREWVLGRVDTAVLAVGSIEAHGLHCPLGADNMTPWYLAGEMEKRHPERILVLPAIPYGHTPDLVNWPGTVSIPTEAFSRYISAVGCGVARWGVKNLILMNGHEGNISPLQMAMERIVETGVRVVLINWWLDYRPEIDTVVSKPGHAGEDETSVLLFIAEPDVDMQHASFNPFRPRHSVADRNGVEYALRHATSGDGRSATRAKGEAIATLVNERIDSVLADLWSDHLFDRDD